MIYNDLFFISTYKWFGPKSLGEGCLVALGKCHLDIASLKKKLFKYESQWRFLWMISNTRIIFRLLFASMLASTAIGRPDERPAPRGGRIFYFHISILPMELGRIMPALAVILAFVIFAIVTSVFVCIK